MTDAEQLQQRMSQVRANLGKDVAEIVDNADTLTDWRYYVRSHPWVCLGAAAALGYLAVPRRLQVMSPDADTLARLARQERLVVQPKSGPQAKRGVVAGLLSFAGNLLLRSAITYAGQQVGKLAGGSTASGQSASSREVAFVGRPNQPR